MTLTNEDARPVDHRARAYTAADVLVDITTKLDPDAPVILTISAHQEIAVQVLRDRDAAELLAHRLHLDDQSSKDRPGDAILPDTTRTEWSGMWDGHQVTVIHIALHDKADR